MSINLSDELHAATTKGKLASAKEVYLDGDKENLQQVGEKTHQLEEAVKGIGVSGGASVATAVSYDNKTSGMTSVTAQGAIDELAAKDKSQDSIIDTKANKTDVQQSVSELKSKDTAQDNEIAKKANSSDVDSRMQEEQTRVNAELDKKFDKENITQELGDSEDKVVSQFALPFRIEESEEFLYLIKDGEDHVLFGIQQDGSVEWQVGIPSPIRAKIQEIVNQSQQDKSDLSDALNAAKDELNAALQAYKQTTDAAITSLQDTKVDKEEGKSLIEDEVKEHFEVIENDEWLNAMVDEENHILFGIKRDTGKPYFPLNEMYHVEQNEEFFALWLDTEDHILMGIRRDGQIIGEIKAVNALRKTIDSMEIDFKAIKVDISNINEKLDEVSIEKTHIYNITWEEGYSLNSNSGDKKVNPNSFISQNINVKEGDIVLYILPANYKYTSVCQLPSTFAHKYTPKEHIASTGMLVEDITSARVSVTTLDGSKPNIDELSSARIVVISNKVKSQYDSIVAVSDSPNKKDADIVLEDGMHLRYLNALVNLKSSVNLLLLPGTYSLGNEVIKHNDRGVKNDTLLLFDFWYYSDSLYSPYIRDVRINGISKDFTNIQCYEDYSFSTEQLSVMSLLSFDDNDSLYGNIGSTLHVEDITFWVNYQKPIICIDGSQFGNLQVSDSNFYTNTPSVESSYPRPWTKPRTVGLTGIIATKGSNRGVANYIKRCRVVKFNIGYDITGEHFVIEDCLAHQCTYAFNFGMHKVKGQQEHPNTMINCSIEHCQHLGQLSLQGCKSMDELKATGKSRSQVLVCTNLSFEGVWFSQGYDGYDDGEHPTLGFEELIDGVTCGEISAEYNLRNGIIANGGSNLNVKYYKQ